MGTRNLTAVVLDGTYRVAQYGQWDGYPSGQGQRVLVFLERVLGQLALESRFTAHVRRCHFLTAAEVEATWRACGATGELVNTEVADRHTQQYPELSRDTGAAVLDLVLEAPDGLGLANHIEFAAESLFCEYAYVVDLDHRVLEAYVGFNTAPVAPSERFAIYNDQPYVSRDGSRTYYPVRLVHTWSFDALPTVAAMEAAYAQFEEPADA